MFGKIWLKKLAQKNQPTMDNLLFDRAGGGWQEHSKSLGDLRLTYVQPAFDLRSAYA